MAEKRKRRKHYQEFTMFLKSASRQQKKVIEISLEDTLSL